jgi:transposase
MLLPKGAMLLADKGYDANALRAAVSTQDAWANIPPKTNRKDPICFSPYLYKARNLIERFFNKIKHYRRIATRYDKLAENYLAALKLVAVRIWLRGNESTSLALGRHETVRASSIIGHLKRKKKCVEPAVFLVSETVGSTECFRGSPDGRMRSHKFVKLGRLRSVRRTGRSG